MKTRKITEAALLITLSIIFARFLSIKIAFFGVDGVRIGIGVLPIMLAGFRNGMLEGAKVGAVADVLGYFLSPGGVYMPHFTLTSALNGVLPPLITGKSFHPARVLLAIVITQIITSLVLVPYFLNLLFDIPYQLIILPRIITVLINTFMFNIIFLVLNRKVNIFGDNAWSLSG